MSDPESDPDPHSVLSSYRLTDLLTSLFQITHLVDILIEIGCLEGIQFQPHP